MAGSRSRNKGQRGERMIVKLLQPIISEAYLDAGYPDAEVPLISRNLNQAQDGGVDLIGLPWLALEVKFQDPPLRPDAWWAQCQMQCGLGQVPVLLYKQTYARRWTARMKAIMFCDVNDGRCQVTAPADFQESDFIDWFRQALEVHL